MAIFQKDLGIKYKLLEFREKKWYQFVHWWVLLGTVALLLSVIVISLIIIWDQIEQRQRDLELDYVLFGPDKEISDLIRISEHRALMYAHDNRSPSNEVIYDTDVYGDKTFDTFDHIPKANPYLLTCYYVMPNRSDAPNKLFPQDIDPSLCSHIIISFAVLRNCTVPLPSTFESVVYEDLTTFKKTHPGLKILLSVISSGSIEDSFGDMVASKSNRKTFIRSALNVLKQYSLDGIDLDWEFPAWPRTKSPEQKVFFVELLKEMREAFSNNYLITIAVAAPVVIVQRAYDIPKIAQYVDYVHLMCYDYHAFVLYDPFTGPNAPLYKSNFEVAYMATLNVNYTVFYWLHQGMPKNKIIVGMPTYGHSWTLLYPSIHDYRALAKGFGSIGAKGFVSQRDICTFTRLEDTAVTFDHETKVPYAYRGTEWISFDNPESLAYKAEFITETGLAGAMVFSLNQDDFTGKSCGTGPYPLIRVIKKVLNDDAL